MSGSGTDLASLLSELRGDPVKRLAKLLTVVWLMAALSLVGWLLVNLDTAGWILLIVTVGLMTFELTRHPARQDRPARRTGSSGSPDEGRD